MALAGHPVVVYLKNAVTAPTGTDEADGITNVGYSPNVDMLETTDFKDTTGFKTKLAGLKDGSISLSGQYEPSDAPQQLLPTSWSSGASVWATMHFNPSGSAGTKGFQVECKVESFEINAAVDGLVEFSATLQFTGAPVAV